MREGSVTRAAERLHRVQSNVTTRIRQLEEDLAVALFIREGKRLHLAPAGQVLLGYAERLLALADEVRGAVRDARPRGTFRIGSMESTAAVRLPGLLTEYHRRHPGVVLELRTGNPLVLGGAILAGDLDAALVTEPIADAPFEKAFAFDEELVIVAPANHPPIGRKGDLPRTVLVFEHGCPHRKRLEDWYANREQMPERTIELAFLADLVANTAAVDVAEYQGMLAAFRAWRSTMRSRLRSWRSMSSLVQFGDGAGGRPAVVRPAMKDGRTCRFRRLLIAGRPVAVADTGQGMFVLADGLADHVHGVALVVVVLLGLGD